MNGDTPAPVIETRKLAAIMFTNIIGFSRQMGADEARMLRLLEVHNQSIQYAVIHTSQTNSRKGVERVAMKTLFDLHLPQAIHHALQAAQKRISAEFDVDRIVLFGSVSRGQADEESDVDLLVVLNDSPSHQERDRITNIILDIYLEYDSNLSELIVDRQTWDLGLPSVLPIHQAIQEEGIPL